PPGALLHPPLGPNTLDSPPLSHLAKLHAALWRAHKGRSVMSPNEQLPLAVFIHRALPKIVTEHLRVPPPGADQTLKQAQDAAGRRVDAMLDLVQPIVAHVDGLNVPTAITTRALAP